MTAPLAPRSRRRSAFHRRPRLSGRKLGACAGGAVLLWATLAHAGNEDEFLVGNEAAMTGGAVTATTTSGESLFYNPAGLGGVEGSTFDTTLSLYGLRSVSAAPFLVLADGRSADANITEIVVVPVTASYVRRLGGDVRAGLGLFVDRWSDRALRTRLLDDEPRASLAVASRFQRLNAILGVGLPLTRRLRFGAALDFTYTTTSQSTQAAFGEGEQGLAYAEFVEQAGVGIRPSAGVQWDIAPRWTLGLSLMLPGARLIGWGSSDTVSAGNLDGAFSAEGSDETTSGWDAEQPQRTRAALAYRWEERGWVSVDVDFASALHDEDVGVARKAQVNARLGGMFPLDGTWALGAGLFSDRSAEEGDDAVDLYGVSLGAQHRTTLALAETEASDRLELVTTAALRYAHGATELTLLDTSGDVPGGRTGALSLHELSLSLGSGLRF